MVRIGAAATPIGSAQIDLNWTDNSFDELGFEIDRSPDNATWNLLMPVAPDITSYSDGSLASATTYYYRVRGYGGSGYSAYSTVASATTAVFDGISLSATGSKTKGWQNVDLDWSAPLSGTIYRNKFAARHDHVAARRRLDRPAVGRR